MIEQEKDKTKILANLEREIERAKTVAEKNWFEIGKALCKIRDQKLHKQRTFEQYALQRWGFKRSRANSLCHTYELLKDSNKSSALDISSAAGEALANVPPEKRDEVLEEAGKNGKPTKKTVRAAAKKTKEKSEIPKDREGYPIPTPSMAIWDRRDELKEKLAFLSELKQWADDMQGNSDPLYAEVVFSGLKLDIEKVIRTLKLAVPYVVCSACQGQAPDTCTMCKGRGMISKYRYHGIPATPDDMKEMRQKLATSG